MGTKYYYLLRGFEVLAWGFGYPRIAADTATQDGVRVEPRGTVPRRITSAAAPDCSPY